MIPTFNIKRIRKRLEGNASWLSYTPPNLVFAQAQTGDTKRAESKPKTAPLPTVRTITDPKPDVAIIYGNPLDLFAHNFRYSLIVENSNYVNFDVQIPAWEYSDDYWVAVIPGVTHTNPKDWNDIKIPIVPTDAADPGYDGWDDGWYALGMDYWNTNNLQRATIALPVRKIPSRMSLGGVSTELILAILDIDRESSPPRLRYFRLPEDLGSLSDSRSYLQYFTYVPESYLKPYDNFENEPFFLTLKGLDTRQLQQFFRSDYFSQQEEYNTPFYDNQTLGNTVYGVGLPDEGDWFDSKRPEEWFWRFVDSFDEEGDFIDSQTGEHLSLYGANGFTLSKDKMWSLGSGRFLVGELDSDSPPELFQKKTIDAGDLIFASQTPPFNLNDLVSTVWDLVGEDIYQPAIGDAIVSIPNEVIGVNSGVLYSAAQVFGGDFTPIADGQSLDEDGFYFYGPSSFDLTLLIGFSEDYESLLERLDERDWEFEEFEAFTVYIDPRGWLLDEIDDFLSTLEPNQFSVEY